MTLLAASAAPRDSSGAATSKTDFSESFKLQLLKSVLGVAAPEESGGAAEAAGKVIDAVAESSDRD